MGCLIGYFYTIGFDIHEMSVKVLYVLMLLLGMNLGGNQDLKGFVAQFNFKMLLVPIATVSGTFLFSAIAGFILSQWSVFDCMAVGSGFAYYSISSVLITQLKTPSMGLQVATELGTIALLANIFREMTALIGTPIIKKYFGDRKVAFAKEESDFRKSYEIAFKNGDKIEFDRKGEWTDIDCKYSAVPTGIIPAPIAKYVADNYPDNKIVQIERDTRSTEVKLDNRMEIKFDKQHRVIEMDF